MSSEQVVTQADIEKVAEMAVEPSYMSEIARKLQRVDPVFGDMGENKAIRIVSRAVQGLRKNKVVTVEHPDYPSMGGQKESSQHTSIAGEGYAPRDEWHDYTVVHNAGTPLSNVRSEFRQLVDTSVTLDDKINLISTLTSVGKEMSELTEDILYDQVGGVVEDYVVLTRSDYNSPGVDCYVQEFTAPNGVEVDRGLALEISTRYVNPIGGPYISNKLNLMMDLEKEYGVPVDLVVLAPKFTRGMINKYEDSDLVHLIQLPSMKKGNPVVTADPPGRQDDAIESDEFGPHYPIITEQYGDFIGGLNEVLRDFVMVQESKYRQEITEAINTVA